MNDLHPAATATGRIFVTGGSGHVGANLVRRLLADGQSLRCLVEPGGDRRAFAGLDVELVEGNLCSADDMMRLVRGCDRVYHVAAKISVLNPNPREFKELYDINVIGTRNVMRAALENGVVRAVMTGSFSAVGYDPEDPSKPSTEDMPFWPFDAVTLPYARTKAQAEHELLKVVADGLDALTVVSCACIGPWDYFPSRMGQTLCDYANGKIRAYIPGGFEFVNPRDLADGHVRGMARGRKGHKYIIATGFHTMDQLVDLWGEALGGRKRPLRLPAGLMSAVSSLYSGSLGMKLLKKPPRLTPGSVRILQMQRHADTTKARTELGWSPTTLREAIVEAYEFFAAEGKIPRAALASPGAGLTHQPQA